MAATTLTLPAADASPPPALSLSSAHDVILALDLGATTGWAVRSIDGAITSGTAEFRLDRWQSGGMRFLRFKRWLTEIKNQAGGFDLVVYGRALPDRSEADAAPTQSDASRLGSRSRGLCRRSSGGQPMKWLPRGYGGERPPEEVKRDGWREQGLLAVSAHDHRLTWPEREFVRQLGNKLYDNCCAPHGGERHDPRT